MPYDWAEMTADRLRDQGLIKKGICLILGAADSGKTTLAKALTNCCVTTAPVGIIDADIGQSHIGPPTTVGWAVADKTVADFGQLSAEGISFVGDITPAGHLLQLTAAICQSVKAVSKHADIIIIDTPGFMTGPTAEILWWTVQRLVQPDLILAVQIEDEMAGILAGLEGQGINCERVKCPSKINIKSPQKRQSYRQRIFKEYFHGAIVYDISLSSIAVQRSRILSRQNMTGRLAALRDSMGVDIAIGLVIDWDVDQETARIRAPETDIRQISCLIIGDVSINMNA
ncbi:MAG: hypothetical protein FVQ82_08330 [Planctomycetes bacterium]|nr:hypothetical protein [Planctomycetota bacterium]